MKISIYFFSVAAGAQNIPFILSTIATSSIEEVAHSAPDTIKWFQLYIYKDRLELYFHRFNGKF
jgi:isopentenyl diphosphate isomerase/L-lactate dehydrogenase-like FMN-dependent dehydrogenase